MREGMQLDMQRLLHNTASTQHCKQRGSRHAKERPRNTSNTGRRASENSRRHLADTTKARRAAHKLALASDMHVAHKRLLHEPADIMLYMSSVEGASKTPLQHVCQ